MSKPFIEMTDKEVLKLKREQCVKCVYRLGCTGKANIAESICNYMEIMGHRRPCSPTECIEKGVFVQRKRGNTRIGKKALRKMIYED